MNAKTQALKEMRAKGKFSKRQLKDREKSWHYSAAIDKDIKHGSTHTDAEFQRVGGKIHRAHERKVKGLPTTRVRGLQ